MGIYSDGKPKFWLLEIIKYYINKRKEKKEFEEGMKRGAGKGLKNNK